MGKAEDTIKCAIKEATQEQHKEISDHVMGIFVWGFGFGIITAYSHIAPIMIGILLGYYVAKQNIYVLDNRVSAASEYVIHLRKEYLKDRS